MGVHFYIDRIQEIKQLIYNEIKKKGVEIDKDLFFNEYYLKIVIYVSLFILSF